MPPASLDTGESEEERLRRLAGGLNAAAKPTLPPVAKPADAMPPAMASTEPAPKPIATAPVMPAMPLGPQTQRFEQLSAEPRPELHGWKKFADVVANLHPLGRAIEQQIPGSPGNYDARLMSAAMRAAKEQGVEREQQKLQQEPVTADLSRRNIESEITARGDKDTATLAKQGLKRDESGNIVADEASPVYQTQQRKLTDAETTQKNIQTYREAQTNLANARTEVERAKNDPNSPAFKQAQEKLRMALMAHETAAQNLGLHQAEFANKIQEQSLVKPSGQAQSRGSAAQAALDVMPELTEQIRNNAAELGPIFGRIQRGEIALGNVDPQIAKLYSSLSSFYALNPAIHGFRNFEFVKDMPSFIGGLERDPESTIAGLEGLKPTLQSVAKEGKTFHKRIVEGQGNTGSSQQKWNPKTGRYE